MISQSEVILSFDVDGMRAFNIFDKLEKDIFLQEGLVKAVEFLKNNDLDATFFLVGQNVRDFPSLHLQLKDFEIGNHSFSHPPHFKDMRINEKKEEIKKAHKVIEEILDRSPQVFRAPGYQIDLDSIKILKEMEYKADSSLIKVLFPFRYWLNYRKQRVLEEDKFEFPLTSFIIPFNGTSAVIFGFKLTRFIFDFLAKRKETIIINFHPRDFVNVRINEVGFVRRNKAVETTFRFLEYIKSKTRVMSFRQFFENHPDLDFGR